LKISSRSKKRAVTVSDSENRTLGKTDQVKTLPGRQAGRKNSAFLSEQSKRSCELPSRNSPAIAAVPHAQSK
jgi:hypothetical protein